MSDPVDRPKRPPSADRWLLAIQFAWMASGAASFEAVRGISAGTPWRVGLFGVAVALSHLARQCSIQRDRIVRLTATTPSPGAP